MKTNKETRIITGLVRLDFPNVYEPKSFKDEPGKYSTRCLISKLDATTLAKVHGAIDAAKKAGIRKFGGSMPINIDIPLFDGDLNYPGDPNYENCFYLNAKTESKPQVIDADGKVIDDPSEIYAGCFCKVSLEFAAYSFEGKNGISCRLGNVKKIKDGDRITPTIETAEDDFADDNEEDEDFFL